jgi:hypothetical protein
MHKVMDDPHKPFFVPVRQAADGIATPQLARLPEGPRTGLAFTSDAALAAACRPGQPWIRVSEPMLRGLLGPLGITRIQVDPVLIVADLARPAVNRNVPVPAPVRTPAPVRARTPDPVPAHAHGG